MLTGYNLGDFLGLLGIFGGKVFKVIKVDKVVKVRGGGLGGGGRWYRGRVWQGGEKNGKLSLTQRELPLGMMMELGKKVAHRRIELLFQE